MRLLVRVVLTLVLAGLSRPAALFAQQPKLTLTAADYGRWETLGAATLSPDGRWLAYQLNRVDEKNELRIVSTERDTAQVRARGATPYLVMAFGTGAGFTTDSRWAA